MQSTSSQRMGAIIHTMITEHYTFHGVVRCTVKIFHNLVRKLIYISMFMWQNLYNDNAIIISMFEWDNEYQSNHPKALEAGSTA